MGGLLNGSIDEVMIFNRSLSKEQMWAFFTNQTNMIASSETSIGDNWTIQITPNDGTEDGATVRSNQVIIIGAMEQVAQDAENNSGIDRRYAINGANVTVGGSSSWNETLTSSDVAQGGNSSHLNLSTTASTIKWQGYFGQISSNLGLSINGNAKTLYSFGAALDDQVKAVYASIDLNFNLANLQSNVKLNNLDLAMGWSSNEIDSANRTFGGGLSENNQTISRISKVQSANLKSFTIINLTSDVAVEVDTVFHSGIFADTTTPISLGDYVFAVQVNTTVSNEDETVKLNRNFLNSTGAGAYIDYELIVPINSTTQQGETPIQKTYYFFMDIE